MYKESRITNGIIRLVVVVAALVFLFGEVMIFAQAQPRNAYTYTEYTTGLVKFVEGKPFDFNLLITWSMIWAAAMYIAMFLIVFIINGFRTKVEHIDKKRKQ